MALTTNAVFLLAALGMGIWFKKDKGFRKREFLLTMLFFILLVGTPWGAAGAQQIQELFSTSVQTVIDTINSVSQ